MGTAKTRAHLFHCFGCEHDGAIVPNTNAVLDTNSDATELFRPPLIIRNIYASGRVILVEFSADRGETTYGSTVIHCPALRFCPREYPEQS